MNLNKPLIRKMIKRIETVPESYDQGTPGQSYRSRLAEGRYDFDKISCRPRPKPECGSVECLMGQAVIANAKTPLAGIRQMYKALHDGVIGEMATSLTGLPESLFGASSREWPEPYRSQWRNARTYKGRARAAVNMLRAILKTDGKILEG
jgi:hypothetical protein